MRIVVHWLLIVSLALGAPVASCCHWGAVARSAVASVAGPVEHGCCCAAAPADEDDSGCDERTRCTCGPAKSIFSEAGADRVTGVGMWAATPLAAVLGPAASHESSASPVMALAQPPPVCSLLRLHCALTI